MLESINGLDDLKKLNIKQLPALCQEIRDTLVDVLLENGGHLASNLGVVELTVALHYVFDDIDKIVWDVGHQSYVHKLLTGRQHEFYSLRKNGGLSGFPTRKESESDVFGVGHASTAISAALGIAKARDIQNQNFDVVAVVGDGSLTGGLSYEGLNSIDDTKMFIILNDNNMAIDSNVGSATKNLSRVRVSKSYIGWKKKTKKILSNLPLIGKPLLKLTTKVARNIRLKKLHNIYFENFNIRYVGPINGHDIKELVFYLTEIKNNTDKPTVLHVLTQKGRGYAPAEENPQKFHGVSSKNNQFQSSMSEIVGKTLVEIAKYNPRIVAITAAMANGTGTAVFRDSFPQRFFDVGIAEEHAVTFAAGLATQGMKPYVAIYSTFLQRAYDQILHDVCIQNLPVTFCIDRAGFVGEDGQTHQGLFDIAFLSHIPNLILLTPSSTKQLSQMLLWTADSQNPVAIRYPKSANPLAENESKDFLFGKWSSFGDIKSDCALLALGGNALASCLESKALLEKKGVSVLVVDACSVKPLDEQLLNLLASINLMVTVEEGVITGGFGANIDTYYAGKINKPTKIIHVAVEDKFVRHATIQEQLIEFGISSENIINILLNHLSK